jgi:hypothetical protein
VATIPAYKVSDEASSLAPSTPKNQEKDENLWKSLAIGAIAIVLGLSCLVITSAFLIKRKFASSDSRESASSGPGTFISPRESDIEDGRLNLVNDTQMAPGDLSMNSIPRESSVNSTPHSPHPRNQGVLVDSTTAPTPQAAEAAPIAEEGNSKDLLEGVVVAFPQRRLIEL